MFDFEKNGAIEKGATSTDIAGDKESQWRDYKIEVPRTIYLSEYKVAIEDIYNT